MSKHLTDAGRLAFDRPAAHDARLDDLEWERLGVRFLQLFHRPPTRAELVVFRGTRAGLQLRLPPPRRQRVLARH